MLQFYRNVCRQCGSYHLKSKQCT